MHSRSLKILGVDIGDNFSVTQHIQRLAASSAQTVYALRVLRTRGLSDAALQQVYRSTVVARLTYAASAWRGLTKASDRQRINSVMDRARRQSYCSPDLPTFDEMCDAADDEFFFIRFYKCRITFCMHCCHHHPSYRNITILDTAYTRYSCLNTPLTCHTVIFLHVCCIKKNLF